MPLARPYPILIFKAQHDASRPPRRLSAHRLDFAIGVSEFHLNFQPMRLRKRRQRINTDTFAPVGIQFQLTGRQRKGFAFRVIGKIIRTMIRCLGKVIIGIVIELNTTARLQLRT